MSFFIRDNKARYSYRWMSHTPPLCIIVDTPTSLNGYPYFAEVLDFVKSNRESFLEYDFNYRIKDNEHYPSYVNLHHEQKEHLTTKSRISFPATLKSQFNSHFSMSIIKVIIKNFNKVGVMTLEDSEFDNNNCTIKRKGSNCKMESMVEFETIPPELINSGCVKISYNIYDFFYTCDYTTTTTISTTTTGTTILFVYYFL